MTEKLEKGTILNVTKGNANLLLNKYKGKGVFGKNSAGEIVVLNDDTVEQDGNVFYYYDDNGRRHLIPEINSNSRDIEEEEDDVEEETDIDEGNEIDEDDDAEEEEYEYEEDEIEEKSDRRNNSRTKFDGKTFYYFPKPKTTEDYTRKIERKTNVDKGNKVTSRNTLDNRILSDEELKSFSACLNKIDGIKVKDGGKIDVSNFKRDKEKVIRGTYLTNSAGEKLYLSNSNTRAKILNNADDIVNNQITEMKSTTSGLHRNIPVNRCLRYVGDLGLAQILEKCRNCSYKDVVSGKGDELRQKIDDCLQFLNLEDDNNLHTKHNLVEAVSIWADKFDKLKQDLRELGEGGFEAKYKEMSNNTSINNLSSGTKRWVAV